MGISRPGGSDRAWWSVSATAPWWGVGEKVSKFEEIKARCEKATRGPWTIEVDKFPGYETVPENHVIVCQHEGHQTDVDIFPDNQEFIVHAREDIPLLLKALELMACELGDLGYHQDNDGEELDYWLEKAAEKI